MVISDNNVRQLETKVCEEQLASANGRKVKFFVKIKYYIFLGYFHLKKMLKLMLFVLVWMLMQRVETLEHEMKRLRKELEIEKVETEASFCLLKYSIGSI